jgi:hypothetical protein
MRISYSALLFAIILLLANFSPLYSQERLGWVRGSGLGCNDACSERGMKAPLVGRYNDGGSFYVCRANVGGEGTRSGSNHTYKRWRTRCTFGYGEDQVELTEYQCLCVSEGVRTR